MKLPVTKKEQAYGSIELIEEVEKILQNQFYLVLKNRGFLSLGETMERAGNLALQIHQKACNQFTRDEDHDLRPFAKF